MLFVGGLELHLLILNALLNGEENEKTSSRYELILVDAYDAHARSSLSTSRRGMGQRRTGARIIRVDQDQHETRRGLFTFLLR